MANKIGCSFSRSAFSLFHFQQKRNAELSLSRFVNQRSGAQLTFYGKDKSYQFVHGMPKLLGRQKTALHNHDSNPEDISRAGNSSFHLSASDGKPGIISFHNSPSYRREDPEVILSLLERTPNSILWFMCLATLVTSFTFPLPYLRRILSVSFGNALVTVQLEAINLQSDGKGSKHLDSIPSYTRLKKQEILMLLFTEAIFYCGVAVYLRLLDHLRRPIQLDTAANNSYILTPQLGQRISSVATLLLGLTIPTVTMGLVRPWAGAVASITLVPYIVGIVVQFTFEQYARYWKLPSRVVIPFFFQVYRLFQLNRAAQLLSVLSVETMGFPRTGYNLNIVSSVDTISNVLQFLLVICIWSISSFLTRFLNSASGTLQ